MLSVLFSFFKKNKHAIKLSLVSVLSLDLAFSPLLLQSQYKALAKDLDPIIQTNSFDLNSAKIHAELSHAMSSDPTLEFIQKLSLPETGTIDLNDPSIDQDPFFLRSQSWVQKSNDEHLSKTNNKGETSEDFSFTSESNSLTLHWKGAQNALRLDGPFTPVSITSEYIFLAGSEGYFTETAQGLEQNEAPGEGLFLISIDEFFLAATKQGKVPVYFLPLPANGWTGTKVLVDELRADHAIIISDAEGSDVIVELSDLKRLVNTSRLNLAMGFAMAMRGVAVDVLKGKTTLPSVDQLKNKISRKIVETSQDSTTSQTVLFNAIQETITNLSDTLADSLGFEKLLPPIGSTAGYGIYFTGYDRDRPELSLHKNLLESANTHTSVLDLLKKITAEVSLVKTAHADVSQYADLLITTLQELTPKLFRVSQVVGSAAVAALVAKFTIYKTKFADRSQKLPNQGPRERTLQAFRDYGDSLSSKLAMLAAVPYMISDKGFGFLIDRYFPEALKGDNSLVRKFYKATFHRMGNRNVGLRTNWKTLLYGLCVYATVDSLMVPVMLAGVNPPVWTMFMSLFGTGAHEYAKTVLSAENSAFVVFAMNESLRNLIAWIGGGSSSRARELKRQADRLAPSVVDPMLDRMTFQSLKERMETRKRLIVEFTELYMDLKGLPSRHELLADVNSIAAWYRKLFGYVEPVNKLKAEDREGVTSLLSQDLAAQLKSETNASKITLEEELNKLVEARRAFANHGIKAQDYSQSKLSELKTQIDDHEQKVRILEIINGTLESTLAHLGIDDKNGHTYNLATERNGLYLPALKAAYKELKRLEKSSADPTVSLAVSVLKTHLRDVTYLGAFVATPIRFFAGLVSGSTEYTSLVGKLRKARATGMALLYDNAINPNAPLSNYTEWQKIAGAPGARLAALAFQNAFFGIDHGEKNALFNRQDISQEDRALARVLLQEQYAIASIEQSATFPWSQVEEDLVANRIALDKSHRSTEMSAAIKDPRGSFYAKWQLKTARNRALARFGEDKGRAYNPTVEKDSIYLQQLFNNEVMRQSAIWPAYEVAPDLKRKVTDTVSLKMQELKADLRMQRFSSSLVDETKMFWEEIEAIETMRAYKKHTVFSEDVNALSPAQPGRLQYFRQKLNLDNIFGSIANRSLRFIEASWPAERHELGLRNRIFRTVPAVSDLTTGFIDNLPILPTYLIGVQAYYRIVWDNRMPFDMFALNSLFFSTLNASNQWLDNIVRNMGWKSQEKVRDAIQHAFVYGVVTNLFYGPQQMLQPLWREAWSKASDLITNYPETCAGTVLVAGLGTYGANKAWQEIRSRWKWGVTQ